MSSRLSRHAASFVVLALVAAGAGCGEDSADAAGGPAGAGASGGGGGEPLPPLDPAACPITLDGGIEGTLADAAEAQWSRTFVAPSTGSPLEDEVFALTPFLRMDPALQAIFASDATLSAIGVDREARLRSASASCGADTACLRAALAWGEADGGAAAAALVAALEEAMALEALAIELRASGRFALFATESDGELTRRAFVAMTAALDGAFDAEAESLGGAALVEVVDGVCAAHPEPFEFFEALVSVDVAALLQDGRDEAIRYQPLDAGENAAALAHVPAIDWAAYPFTMILVPGQGPTDLETPLAEQGKARADLAAHRYFAGVAPLIALSGGHVHPDRTPYAEALEMKRYLRDERGIPEEALWVDPHARHTTTNLRNVTRLLYHAGIPADRPLLVTSDLGQSLYIGYWHGTFGPRCEEELGYLPWRALVPISPFDACMRPTAVSLHRDGRDPLDP